MLTTVIYVRKYIFKRMPKTKGWTFMDVVYVLYIYIYIHIFFSTRVGSLKGLLHYFHPNPSPTNASPFPPLYNPSTVPYICTMLCVLSYIYIHTYTVYTNRHYYNLLACPVGKISYSGNTKRQFVLTASVFPGLSPSEYKWPRIYRAFPSFFIFFFSSPPAHPSLCPQHRSLPPEGYFPLGSFFFFLTRIYVYIYIFLSEFPAGSVGLRYSCAPPPPPPPSPSSSSLLLFFSFARPPAGVSCCSVVGLRRERFIPAT